MVRACLVVFVICCPLCASGIDSSCPLCSKFSYEEKTMDKLLRMDFKIENMETYIDNNLDSVRGILADYNSTLEQFNEQYKDMETFIVGEVNKKTADIARLEEKLDHPLIAFNAFEPATTHLTTNQTIRFITAPLNIGEGYNPDTGIFTAPIAGLYQFSAHICTRNGYYVTYAIIHGTTTVALSFEDTDESCSSVTGVTQMNEGDEVLLRCMSSYSTYQLLEDSNRRSSFIGMLLQKLN